jgi:UDP:flavonoid glycosyltransferase YjiC (YdhE family)/pimeloyl-ACP methyl ester carboxylesterase
MPKVTANGISFNVQRLGKGGGRPVVFLHGLVMDNLSSWYFTVANRVARSREVILYDLRGHGRSDRTAEGYRIDDMVADLAALLDALDVHVPVALVGNSFGGQLAIAFAAAHPDRVEGLALVDAHVSAKGWGDAMAETLELEGEAADERIAESFASWLGRHSDRKRNRLAKAARALVYGTSLIPDLRASGELTDDDLRSIECRVLGIYGEQSDAIDRGRHLAATLPDCELRALPGCSHSVLWEATAEVRDQLVDWLTAPVSRPRRPRPEPKRFLFVVPPLVGHTNPTISVARALSARGHDVAWVGHPRTVRPLLPAGAELFALDDDLDSTTAVQMSDRATRVRGPERLKFLWEDFFIPLANAMLPGVDAAVESFRPDAMIVDQQTIAGAVVATRRGIPWATMATTSAGVVDPLAKFPKVRAWLDRLVGGVQEAGGIDVLAGGEISPHLVLALTTEALVGATNRLPPHYRFVGPSISDRPESADFPWQWLDADEGARRVLISLGTVNADAGARFYREAVEAVAGTDIRAVLVAPPDLVGTTPDNVLVRSFVPQLALLPRMDAVVTHAGHNTVVESLANALPLVVAPIKDDQPVVAQQVVDAGAGVRVRFGRVRAPRLREALFRVLDDPSFASAAGRVRDSFARAGGAERAARLLEELS